MGQAVALDFIFARHLGRLPDHPGHRGQVGRADVLDVLVAVEILYRGITCSGSGNFRSCRMFRMSSINILFISFNWIDLP